MNGAAPRVLVATLAALSIWYIGKWIALERRSRSDRSGARPRPVDLLIGFGANFFDTLGIGSFAPTTAFFKLRKEPADEDIPGTLNAGHALPTVTQALIFLSAVSVDVMTLVGMIAAAVLGAWLGVGVVSRLPQRAIQLGMGLALLTSAMLFIAKNLEWMPGGGDALGLTGWHLALAIALNFVFGALMMLGVGLYAPCLILICLLGMNPLSAFPIMMGACAFLMPIGGARFIERGRYRLPAALGLTLGGIPGVLLAAFVVKSLPIIWLRWLVAIVVIYAALLMLSSARRTRGRQARDQARRA
jgi:uncharacterized membrane protein YfcA